MDRSRYGIKLAGTVFCELFVIITVAVRLARGDMSKLPLAFVTLLLVALPLLLERHFHCRICLPLFLFSLIYALGPFLGNFWRFYFHISVWDKLLHISGGVIFAILGVYLFWGLTRGQDYPVARILFGLCFSLAISLVWELIEFGADTFLGVDMQRDTVIHSLTSYILGNGMGVTGSISNIENVAVNGVPLPVKGYIDIGLVDSMLDMLLETVGAIVTCLLIWLDKGKHPLVRLKEAPK